MNAQGFKPKEADLDQENRAPARPLPPAAERALAEAQARRNARSVAAPPATEIGGRDGPDPVRFGDWEKNGIAIDF